MSFISCGRLTALAIPLALALAACGSSTAVSLTPAPSATPTAGSVPLPVLTAADVANSGSFSQKSDSLLGGLANTDARVFGNADSSVLVEIDLVSDTGATRAASDYPPYQSAAAKQVGTPSATSTPVLGQKANEFVGSAAGKNVVSISFIEGKYIAVVTTVGMSTTTPDVIKTSAESIAQAQDNKITRLGG
jgi:hypothetical protein